MNDLIVKSVSFCQAELLAVQDKATGKIYAGINCILRELGFNEKQIRYRRDKWIDDKSVSKGVRKFLHPSVGGGNQETYCIDIKKLPIALAKIEITPKMENEMPELSEKLEKYQDECADVLADAFLSKENKMYIPKDYSSALRLAADEHDKRIIAEQERDIAIKEAAEKDQQLELQKPFLQAVIKLQNTDGTVSLKEAADMICGNGLQIGRNTMMALLREHKILTKSNEAINRYVQQDIFRVVQTTKVDQYGKTRIFPTTRVTAKGLIYLNTRVREWLGVEQLDIDFEKIINESKYAWLDIM